MPNLTSVGITDGVPSSGTGTVSTLDAVLAKMMSPFETAVAPTVTAGAYSAGNIMGALMTFACASANDAPFKVDSVHVAFLADVAPSLRLILFKADPSATTKTDKAAYSLNTADAFKVIAALSLSTMDAVSVDHGTPHTFDLGNLDLSCIPASGTQNIFALLVDDTGVTLASTSDVQVTLRGRR